MSTEPDFARLHVDTQLRYSAVPAGMVEPCPLHPRFAALQVTSKTRKWTGDDERQRNFPVTIQEHPPVCSVCFTELQPKESDDRTS